MKNQNDNQNLKDFVWPTNFHFSKFCRYNNHVYFPYKSLLKFQICMLLNYWPMYTKLKFCPNFFFHL